MGIKIKNRDPKTTDFSNDDIVINHKEGTLFYKSDTALIKLGPSTSGSGGGGGGGGGSSDNLGNHTATQDLDLDNNNITNVTTGSFDTVGIGTSTPAYTLDLSENSSTIRLVSEDDGTAIRIGAGGASNDVTLLRVDGETNSHDGESDNSKFGFSLKYMGSRVGNENSLSIFSDAETGTAVEALTVLQDGKVGIGATSPKSKLHVLSTTTMASNTNISSSRGLAAISIQQNTSGLSPELHLDHNEITVFSGSLFIGAVSDQSGEADINFRTSIEGTGLTTRMTIDGSTGNVGIGSTSPGEKLTVHGDISASTDIHAADYFDNGININSIYAPITGGTGIVTVGTITDGTWNGTAIAHDYIGLDAIDGTNITDNAINSEHYTDGSIDTVHIGDDQVTYAKIQNVTNARILGNNAGSNGNVTEMTKADVLSFLNVEDGATAGSVPEGTISSSAQLPLYIIGPISWRMNFAGGWDASEWGGPVTNFPMGSALWNQKYGDNAGVTVLDASKAGHGFKVPVDSTIKGFSVSINTQNETSTHTVALYTGSGNHSSFNDTSGTAGNLPIIQKTTASTTALGAADQVFNLVKDDANIDIAKGDYIYVRIRKDTGNFSSPKNVHFTNFQIIMQHRF